MKQSGVFAPV